MGGNQSTPGDGGAPVEVVSRTSYYELLSIERTATEDEIKKAYRRKALELHPDRNYGTEEHATRLFSEVQTAYEVLSDPQERAWYDSHESAILSGHDPANTPAAAGAGDGSGAAAGPARYHNMTMTSADDIYRSMRRFNSGIAFSDAPSGFFGFLNDLFAQLAKEEEVAADDPDGVPEYPPFGHKDDAHDDVVREFYGVWTGFATRKTFAWTDKYRLTDAPDRRIRRLMEKENRRGREEAAREFSDAVRGLVAFVKKRDPRFVANSQTEAERQKVLRDAAAAQAKRAREANNEKLQGVVADWVVNGGEGEGSLDGMSGEDEEEDEEIEEEHFECVACRKTFKSEQQWQAHERSKKHQKAMYELRKEMRAEDKQFHLGNGTNKKATKKQPTVESEEDEEEFEDAKENGVTSDLGEDEDDTLVDEDEGSIASAESSATGDPKAEQPTKDTTHSKNQKSDEDEDEDEDEDDDDGGHEDHEDHSISPNISTLHLSPTATPTTTTTANSEDEGRPAQPRMGKAAQKRAKKAAALADAQSKEADRAFACAVCRASFPSKSRMFQHIKDFGHAAPPSAASKVNAKAQKGGKWGKKRGNP